MADLEIQRQQGFTTAFVDGSQSSNLAYKPEFVSNNYREGKKVLSSIERELFNCDEFQYLRIYCKWIERKYTMKTIRVVAAIIKATNEAGETIIFTTQRGYGDLKGGWEFPGGKIEEGELPEQTLAREIQEELECQIEVHEMVADIVHEYPTFIINLITYKATIISGTPINKEHAELRWVSLEQLRTLEWAPADIPTIDAILTPDKK